MDNRNGYMLGGRSARRGYDWWWHSLCATSEATGMIRPFFIEYFFINPALDAERVVLGQDPENRKAKLRPCYGMLMAGFRDSGESAQIHNYYPLSVCRADGEQMDVRIGDAVATETRLSGSVALEAAEARARPELMSDPGRISWELSAEKLLSYSVGWGTSRLLRSLGALQMSWHIAGMLTRYSGRIICNGETYKVEPETSYGYQDKNWGSDYTNLWVWLNCNSFTSDRKGRRLSRTSLVLGGGRPVLFGIPFPRRLLVAFYYEGELFEFNFSKFWTGSRQTFGCPVTEEQIEWNVEASNRKAKIEIHFSCPRDSMIRINYENPDGRKLHDSLWNGGHAQGTVRLLLRTRHGWEELDLCRGEYGGCEFGEQR